MIDTLDLVVTGCRDKKYYTLSCYDDINDEFISIAMIPVNQLPSNFKCFIKKDPRVVCAYEIDHWFYPENVIEVSYHSIKRCISKMSPFLLIDCNFIKTRKDKNCDQATTLHEISSLYNMQN